MLYNIRRINEVCKEHVENNFHPLPKRYVPEFEIISTRIEILFNDTLALMQSGDIEAITVLRRHCDGIKDTISDTYHRALNQLREGDTSKVTVLYVYINMLQETQEMVSSIRKYLRAFAKLRNTDFTTRRALVASEM